MLVSVGLLDNTLKLQSLGFGFSFWLFFTKIISSFGGVVLTHYFNWLVSLLDVQN